MSRLSSLFSYYGSKSKVAHLYPRPQYPLIIEPFAGSAAYSVCWRDRNRDVLLNELSQETYLVWSYLLSTETEDILKHIPAVSHGTVIRDKLPKDAHPGLLLFLQSWATMGVFGDRSKPREKVGRWGLAKWKSMTYKIRNIHPLITHWKARHGSYDELDNVEATWFIDPPYANSAGKLYKESADAIDFQALGDWCRSRKGQVIVCENEGADWLPFRPICKGRRGEGKFKVSIEVIWTNEKQGLLY